MFFGGMRQTSLASDLTVTAQQVADSRGRPTVQVQLQLGDLSARGDVPAGASKGADEAQTVPVAQALENIQTILLPLLRETAVDLRQHAGLVRCEEAMAARAGANFADLGANATLPLSRALWQLVAQLHGLPLYAYIRRAEPSLASEARVQCLMNIYNGGLHALRSQDGEVLGRDRIDIQEIMVVPTRVSSYRQAMAMGEAIDQALKGLLQDGFGAAAVSRADEAGFSVKGLGDSSQAIGLVVEAIRLAGFTPGGDVKLALDVAASSFYDAASQRYQFQGRALTTAEMIAYLEDFADRYAGMVLSIEDGLDENDWAGWTTLSAAMSRRGILTIGDDLFVTQLPRLRRGLGADAAHAILIKVNQNGTVHGTLQVMKLAQSRGMRCVVSHRSGETLDVSIADLALATGALGLKSGDPQPPIDFPDAATWVRRAKYLRLVAIEEGT